MNAALITHTTQRPSVRVAVLMERESAPNQWEAWRYTIADVVLHEDAFGTAPRVLRDDGMPRGAVFVPFAYYEAAANLLTNAALDPVGKIPEFKYCAVQVLAGGVPSAVTGY